MYVLKHSISIVVTKEYSSAKITIGLNPTIDAKLAQLHLSVQLNFQAFMHSKQLSYAYVCIVLIITANSMSICKRLLVSSAVVYWSSNPIQRWNSHFPISPYCHQLVNTTLLYHVLGL